MPIKSLIKSFAPDFALSAYHLSLAFLAAVIYGFPSESMVVIGVTGTKGKSTTIYALAKILEHAGLNVAVSSSLMFKIKENEWLNPHHMTMAGRFKLQEFLYNAKLAGCQYAIIETTSEGIKQHRHRFINFDVAVFTNLTPEHIEAHGGFENYKKAKGKLFEALSGARRKIVNGKAVPKISVLNMDDANVDYYMSFKADKKYGFGLKNQCKLNADENNICLFPSSYNSNREGNTFILNDVFFKIPLLGSFNVYNALCAAVAAKSLGVDFKTASESLKHIEEVPGRMKFVRVGQKFTAIIDLAHTPPSFQEMFGTVSQLRQPNGRIIALFGSAGGGRDKWKRPELGKIAAKYADHIILTNEDPYDENPADIFSAIEEGIKSAGFVATLEIITDRRVAIKHAVNIARWNDIALFLGKGTEQTMVVGEQSLPWNEEEAVMIEIRNMLYDRK